MNENLRELVADYCEALRSVRELKAKVRKRQDAGKADLAVLNSMEKDLKWAIEYMKTGYMPVDGKRHYKRKVSVNPQQVLCWYEKTVGGKMTEHSETVLLNKLKSALRELSPQEREALLLVKGQGISYGKAAVHMHIGKSTVGIYVERAFDKVLNVFKHKVL